MTYPSLLTALYANFDSLWARWTSEVDRAGDIGVFTFLPEWYTNAVAFRDAAFAFWPLDRAHEYLQEGHSNGDFGEFADDVEVAEEFLVMIVEPPGGTEGRPVHVHKIRRIERN
jgi:hypothetical protein